MHAQRIMLGRGARLVVLLSLLVPAVGWAAGVRFNAPVTIENSVNYFNDAGSTNSYAGSLAGEGFQGGAYIQGACVAFTANWANTAAATLSVNGITPAAIKKMVNGSAVDLATNDICVDQQVHVCFEQTYWQMVSPVCNVSAATDFSSLTGTASDAQIPHLNVLSTGLTVSRCVETDGAGNLSVAAGACGISGGSTGISGATLNAPLYALGGTTATSTAALTNGQLLLGSTGNPPVPATLTGTANQIQVTPGAGSLTLALAAAGVTLPGTTTLASPLGIASGGTGTGATLTGLLRGGAAALTAAELSGDVTTNGSNSTTLAAGAVTLAKMAPLVTDRLLGRDTTGTGAPEALTVGGGLEFTGTGGIQRSAFTGDVTVAAGSTTATIAAGVVTYAKIQNVSATDRLLGRDAAGPGIVEEITPANVKIMLGLDQVTNTADGAKNVATAVALATNGANCGTAGTFPTGVDAGGGAENCTALVADPGSNGLVHRTSATGAAALTSTTVGQTLRVTGPNAFAFGALDLSSPDAIINDLPYGNLTPATAVSRLLGRGAGAGPGNWEEISLGTTLTMIGTELQTTGVVPTTRTLTTTAPLAGGGDLSANRTVSIADAAADGTTKGAATFAAADFNATAGLVSLDYPNGQAASGSLKGFLTSTDWTTFNAKLPPTGGTGLVAQTTATTTAARTLTGTPSNITVSAGDGVAGNPTIDVGSNIAKLDTSNTWADGIRQTFNPNATTAGLNVGAQAGDPSTPTNGDLWYDSTANELTARINGANVALGAGGGGTPGGSPTQIQYNNAGAFGGSAGATFDADAQTTQRDKCTTISTSTTLGTHLCVYVNTSGGNVTLTLPNAAMTNSAADVYYVYKVSSDANQLILAPNAGDNLNFAAATLTTTVQGEGFRMVEQDGAATGNWIVERAQTKVTLAQLPDIATDSFLGRDTPGTGSPEVLTAAQARDLIHAAGLVKSVWIPAGNFEVNGACAVGSAAVLLTNGPKTVAITCTDATADSIETMLTLPDGWNGGPLTVEMTAFNVGSNASTLVYEMSWIAKCVGSGEAPGTWAAVNHTTDAATSLSLTTADNVLYQATSPAITAVGGCAAGDTIFLKGEMDATATTMTPMADVKLLGVKVEYAINAQD